MLHHIKKGSPLSPWWPLDGTRPQHNVPSVNPTQFREATAPLTPLPRALPCWESLAGGRGRGETRLDHVPNVVTQCQLRRNVRARFVLIDTITGTRKRSQSKTKRLQTATKALPWNSVTSPPLAEMACSGEKQNVGAMGAPPPPGRCRGRDRAQASGRWTFRSSRTTSDPV